MTTDTFIQNFDLLAEAPGGVPKLRELILQLAVSGKLVPQEEGEFHHEGHEEHEGGKGKKKDVDGPYPLPQGWRRTLLGEVLTLSYGKSLPRAKRVTTGSVPVYGANGILAYHDTPLVKEDCIVVGRKGSAGALNRAHEPCWPSDVTYFVIPPDCLEFSYCFIVLQSLHLERLAKGIKPGLNRNTAYKLPFPLPPLPEQKRIVAKVDELMKRCDELAARQNERNESRTALTASCLHAITTAARKTAAPAIDRALHNFPLLIHTPESVAELRKTILQLAVQGRLVPQYPKDEPAAILLKSIRADMKASPTMGSRKRIPEPPQRSESNTPFELPSGWAWARFSELGEFARGKSKHRPRNDPMLYRDGAYRMVQTGDVARAEGLITTYTALYNEIGLSQSRMWPAGTMCITIAANIADSAILGFDACFPDSVVGFVPSPRIGDAQYFEFFVRTAKERLTDYAPSTAQKNINMGILNTVMIPLPPIRELKRIVAKVNELMSLCAAVDAKLTQSRADAAALAAAVVHHLCNQAAVPLRKKI